METLFHILVVVRDSGHSVPTTTRRVSERRE